MNTLKTATLNSLALHCGYPTASTKAARVAAIANYDAFFSSLPASPTIVSVDVGIKNFSYCKVAHSDTQVSIVDWNHLNLHEKYGSTYRPRTTDPDSLVDSKAYMAHMSVGVVNDILMPQGRWPDIITIENQRTRSNGKTSTLPNVLLNFTLENMIYAACEARGASTHRVAVMPMNSNKMVNFWISRFVNKSSGMSSAHSKTLRTQLLFGWLSHPNHSPFDLQLPSLPLDFARLSYRKQTSALLQLLKFETRPKKVDDLVDCLLYNLMCLLQLRHHRELKQAQQDGHDIAELVRHWDSLHCRYLRPLLDSTELELAGEYSKD